MANTDNTYALPDVQSGIVVTASATSWAFGQYETICDKTLSDIIIMGLQFQITKVPASDDVTEERLFEIATGRVSIEVTQLQIPYSNRRDTSIAYYQNQILKVTLPEGFFVPTGTRIVIRAANSIAVAVAYNGVKVLYQAVTPIPYRIVVPNNYRFGSVGDGMSCTEKIR